MDAPWIERVRTELDASARDLDAATLSRLNRARQVALEAAHARPSSSFEKYFAWRWPAALAAALSLVLAVGLWNAQLAERAAPTGVAAEDFELIAGEDNLELYDEDLEFYAWLDAQSSSEG